MNAPQTDTPMSCNYPPDQTYCVHVTPLLTAHSKQSFLFSFNICTNSFQEHLRQAEKLNIIFFSPLPDRRVASGEQIHLESHFELHLITRTGLAKENISVANAGALGEFNQSNVWLFQSVCGMFYCRPLCLAQESTWRFPFTSALCSNHYLFLHWGPCDFNMVLKQCFTKSF